MENQSQVSVGQSSGPMTMTISTEWNRAYRAATDDTVTPETADGMSIAPPMMIALIGRQSMSWIPVAPGAVHAKQSYSFARPLPVDTELTVESTILETFEKRGKNYVVIGVTVHDAAGQLIGRGSTTRINSFNPEGGK